MLPIVLQYLVPTLCHSGKNCNKTMTPPALLAKAMCCSFSQPYCIVWSWTSVILHATCPSIMHHMELSRQLPRYRTYTSASAQNPVFQFHSIYTLGDSGCYSWMRFHTRMKFHFCRVHVEHSEQFRNFAPSAAGFFSLQASHIHFNQ